METQPHSHSEKELLQLYKSYIDFILEAVGCRDEKIDNTTQVANLETWPYNRDIAAELSGKLGFKVNRWDRIIEIAKQLKALSGD